MNVFCLTSARRILYVACLALPVMAFTQELDAVRTTIEAVGSTGRLTGNLPNANATNIRGTWDLPSGDVIRAEFFEESKFDARGGGGGFGFVKILSSDWYVSGNLTAGHGGPNWAESRVDAEVSTKWTDARDVVTRIAAYHARFEGDRSDRGARLAVVGYMPNAVVLEGGITLNISDPGSVHSQMPYLSATLGHEGVQYISVRVSSGSEAYQAIGPEQQLVDFKSRSLSLGWRRWVNRNWGVVAQAEQYNNPSYDRVTLGAGVFVQWK